MGHNRPLVDAIRESLEELIELLEEFVADDHTALMEARALLARLASMGTESELQD